MTAYFYHEFRCRVKTINLKLHFKTIKFRQMPL